MPFPVRATAVDDLRRHLEATPLALVEWDRDYRVTRFSRRAEELFGWTAAEVLGRRIDEMPWVPSEDWPKVRTVMEDMRTGLRATNVTANRNLRKDGRTIRCEWYNSALHDESGALTSVLSLVLDVTPREEALEALARNREQLAIAARLASLGTLASGLAHEINNPLAGELAGQGLAIEAVREVRDRLRGGDPLDPAALSARLDEVLEILADAQGGGLRIARIVRSLNVMGRPDLRRQRVRLRAVVDEALRRVGPDAGHRAELVVDEAPTPEVQASPGHLEQVVEALLDNAIRAIPAGRRGAIAVRLGAGPEGTARIEVQDDGAGIPRDVLPRIFDPFFTTRDVGQGTGLGLAVAHAIVTAHGGTLTVESRPGRGSLFRIELPGARC